MSTFLQQGKDPAGAPSRAWLGIMAEASTTIRGRIFTAFVAMGLITGLLGAWATFGIFNSSKLVIKTFDQSLMSVSYARAAAADFASMRAAFTRRFISLDPDMQAKLDTQIDELRDSLADDISIAAERSQSARAKVAANKVKQAVAGWMRSKSALEDANPGGADWSAIDAFAADVEREVDLLVNYTAGDGFLYREHAQASVANDLRFNIAGTCLALGLSALIAWFLARRIIRPVAVASSVANRIANGRLDGDIPRFGSDELGALLVSMATMRDNIRAMMEREVAMRQSAQSRLADAVESSQDGLIVMGPDRRIALANARAADLLGMHPEALAPGTPIGDLAAAEAELSRRLVASLLRPEVGAEETVLPDGRWLRVSRSATREGGFIVLCSDISAEKDQEAQLQATNIRLDAALGNMSQGLCLFGADSRLQVVNRRFCEIFQLAPESIAPGMNYREVIARLHAAGHFTDRPLAGVVLDEYRLLDQRDQAMRFLHIADGRVVGIARETLPDGSWLATYEDVTERRQAEDRIAFMANHDVLTSLPNRALFTERMSAAVIQAERGIGCAVLFVDLDHFKPVNDTLGHSAGDELLRGVAERLSACTRDVDTVARLGGDEFAIVQCGIANPEQAVALANRLIESLAVPFNVNGHSVSIGASVGVSLAPSDGNDVLRLMKNADVALYRAKEDGRGTWRFFEAAMDSRLQARREMELDLRNALDENQFALEYQPLFDLQSDRVTGFEALLRWHHPRRGLIAPGDFIPLAEETGVIRDIGSWVLRTACTETMRWPGHLKVAVNVSPVQLKTGDFYADLTEALAVSALPANRLELEITESVVLANSGSVFATLNRVRELGVQLSMDDFGTGYSSLMSLRSYPFNKIKIDKTFVQDLSASPGAELVIRAVIVLGGGLGMRITAEGVETSEQLARLRMEGCDEIQGYLISPPVPASKVPALLERWNQGSRRGLIAAVA